MSGERIDERRLRELLREAPVPGAAEAERRGRAMIAAAYAERSRGGAARSSLPRLVLAMAAATLLAALLLSPAGAAVRNWVDDVFVASAPRPEPTLSEIPGGGRLLVQSAGGPWVVQPDGSRRLLGDYEEATWSPRGLFVGTVAGRSLSAVEPDGTPHWSITARARASEPRWAPSGERIAYRSGRALRVIAGDGTGDHLIAARTAPVAPAWTPVGHAQLAYVDAAGMLRVAGSESGAGLDSAPALPRVATIEWGADGSSILEAAPDALRLQTIRPRKLAGRPEIENPRRLRVPPRAAVADAAISPRDDTVAAILGRDTPRGRRSVVVLFERPRGPARRLLSVPGSLGEVLWSPDGSRLLVAWPDADQWLFLPVGRGKGRSVAGISRAFAPGKRGAGFPRIEGWCC